MAAGRRGIEPSSASESDSVLQALAGSELNLLDAMALRESLPPAEGEPAAGRRSIEPESAAPPPSPRIELDVPVGAGESSAVLIERDGVYSWHFADTTSDAAADDSFAAPSTGPRRRGAPSDPGESDRAGADEGAAGTGDTRTAAGQVHHFVIDLADPDAPAAPARRGFVSRMILGKVVAYVFRFATGKLLGAASRRLERHIEEGLLGWSPDGAARWSSVGDEMRHALPHDRPARVLLFVHGTFSSTEGSFGGWSVSPSGKQAMQRLAAAYDLVLGYEHRSLSALPSENADALAGHLAAIAWPHPPEVDIIAFSRGGLVTRCLVEQAIDKAGWRCNLRRAVFVACTLGGTELARASNWRTLVDRHTNLVALAARAVAAIPGVGSGAAVLAAALRGVGDLVKVLATSAVDDAAVPGLSAMDPDGDFLRQLNQHMPANGGLDPSCCLAVRSNFEPEAADAIQTAPSTWLRMADRASDSLLGTTNDLVVHTDSMVALGPTQKIPHRHEFGSNARVHHCNYFLQPDTQAVIERWLLQGRMEAPP